MADPKINGKTVLIKIARAGGAATQATATGSGITITTKADGAWAANAGNGHQLLIDVGNESGTGVNSVTLSGGEILVTTLASGATRSAIKTAIEGSAQAAALLDVTVTSGGTLVTADTAITLAGGVGAYVTLGNLLTKNLSLEKSNPDATNDNSAGWQELVQGGVKSLNMTGDMHLTKTDNHRDLLQDWINDNQLSCQIIIDGFARIEGDFFVTGLSVSTSSNDPVTGNVNFRSTGAITITNLVA